MKKQGHGMCEHVYTKKGKKIFKESVIHLRNPFSHYMVRVTISSAVSACPQVVSALRHKHGAVVLFCPLTHGGYVVSGRLVVERRETGELGTLTSSNKLISRLQRLRPMYDRVALILEETAAKEGRRAW